MAATDGNLLVITGSVMGIGKFTEITVEFTNASPVPVFHAGGGGAAYSFVLKGAANYTPAQYEVMKFVWDSATSHWVEVSRTGH